MSKQTISATISNVLPDQGAAVIPLVRIQCQHCGRIHWDDPMEWEFDRKHNPSILCRRCGQDMNDIKRDYDSLTITEQAIYRTIKEMGPITGEYIAEEVHKTQDFVYQLLKKDMPLRRMGVQNRKGAGYYIPQSTAVEVAQ